MSALTNDQRREEYRRDLRAHQARLTAMEGTFHAQQNRFAALNTEAQAATAKDVEIGIAVERNDDKIKLLKTSVTNTQATSDENLRDITAQRKTVKKAAETLKELGQSESTGKVIVKCLSDTCKIGTDACKVVSVVTVVTLIGAGGGVLEAYVESDDPSIGGICGALVGLAVSSAGVCAYYYGKKCIAKGEACLAAARRCFS